MTLLRPGSSGPNDLVRGATAHPPGASLSRADQECAGLVVVHRSGTLTCSEPTCDDDWAARSPFERHVSFFSCDAVLGQRCEDCGPLLLA
jgi:hypothetical protein